MRYSIVTVGRSDRGVFARAVERYLARLDAVSVSADLRSVKASRAGTAAERRAADGAALAKAAGAAGGRAVLLDERGTSLTTAALAERVRALELRGESRLVLLVGGADGVDETVRGAVGERWSLSPLTLPHELALVVLLEQLYRVESLAQGHPYHRP